MASNLIAMASNLREMASTLVALSQILSDTDMDLFVTPSQRGQNQAMLTYGDTGERTLAKPLSSPQVAAASDRAILAVASEVGRNGLAVASWSLSCFSKEGGS